MVERDPSDVPPGPNPNPPADAQLSGKPQVLAQIRAIKKSLTAIEKWVRKQPAKKAAAKRPAKRK